MRRRAAIFVLSLPCLLLTTSAPAQAAGGKVDVRAAWAGQGVGNGFVVVAVCTAHATPGPGETAVATSVSCTVNGFSSGTVTLPGADAAVVTANATTKPVTLCLSSQAIFSSPFGVPYVVVNNPPCQVIIPG